MAIITFFRLVVLGFALTGLAACQNVSSDSRIYEKLSRYNYQDTLLNLDVAISEFNYRIIHRSNIGQAIRDRGDKDYPLSTIITFCNISYAKQMLEIDPKLINDMSCNIAVRETDDGQVIVSSKLMDTQVDNAKQVEFANKINQDLKGIIQSTID